MKKYAYLSIILLIVSELLIFSGNTLPGLGLHLLNLLVIIFVVLFYNHDLKVYHVLQGLTLVVLLRVVGLSMPQFFTDTLIHYPLVYGVMFIPIYYVIKNQQLSKEELGISIIDEKCSPILLLFKSKIISAVVLGVVVSFVEYKILHTESLISTISLSNLLLLSIIMFMFIGLVEGLIFFSILQTGLEKLIGMRYGLLMTGVLFGVMHSAYGMVDEVLYATVFGIGLAYFFQNMKALPFIVVVLGTTNLMVYGILPLTGWFI